MSQLSRPYQIALAALALFAAVWFVALHGHNSSAGGGSGSSAPASASAPSAAAQAKSAAAPTSVYHGAAPGVAGLTRAIAKAHGAVAQSQREAKRVETSAPSSASSADASADASAARSASHVKATAAGHSSAATASTHARSTSAAASSAPSTTRHGVAARPRMQALVERELRRHKTVLILFWSPRGADDVAVHDQLPAVSRSLGARIAVHTASAHQVGAFGSITHAIQVYQTPTLLIVNPHDGHTTTLTGLTDAFAIEQAISQARHSK